LNPQTDGTVDAGALGALPTGAVFVNVGRGGLVEEEALLAAARAGRLRLALDVVTQEPLASDSPFLALDDAVLSPHVAGPTADRHPDCGARALGNLSQFLRGEVPSDLLSLAAYDRAT
jgi:phosphoglycerate dehydrogenase-like enzyme